MGSQAGMWLQALVTGLQPCVHSGRDLGLEQFGSLVVSQGRVQGRVVKGVLALIHKER